jgi:formylglycine-generating enzyme required for sulfatase activity
MLSLGHLLRDRYRIDALPESGQLVYRAYDTVEHRIVAVRELEGEPAARLERDAEALLSHRHPNLPVFYEAFTLDSRLYAVFEWPEGESLHSRLKREGSIGEDDAVRWTGQILSALDYIHTLNLPIARDGFSPAHIWIAPDGRPRLYAGLTAITSEAPYVAPEGGGEPRAHIYAAGATLYNLLTVHSPEPASPRKYNPTITTSTTQIIQRALNQRPEGRYVSIRDMRKALGRAKSNDKVVINLGSSTPSLRLAPFAIGLVALVLVIAGIMILRPFQPIAAVRDTDTPAASGTEVESNVPTSTLHALAPSQASTPATAVPTNAPTFTARPTRTPVPPTPSATQDLTPVPGATSVAEADGMTLLFVPAGAFTMGSPDDDPQAFGNEKPAHVVQVPAFWIDQTEVTNRQYQACVAAAACTQPIGVDSATRTNYYADPQYAGHPVILVSWRQAGAYCAWAGRRLPTEPEWEKAARGTDGRLYPWGNQAPDNTLLNFNLAALDTTRVGAFPNGASPYGAFDMAGNVVEWVDGFYYDSYFVFVRNTVTPTPAFLGGVRILRSSSWHDLFENIRVASRRFAVSETSAYNDVGFRCAADTP